MGVRKAVEETVVVDGTRSIWIERSRQAMELQGFKKVNASETLGQIRGDFKQKIGTTWGDLVVTLTPEGETQTRMHLKATANVDNIYAVFKSPSQKIIDRFKAGLP